MNFKAQFNEESSELVRFAEKIHSKESLADCFKIIQYSREIHYDKDDKNKFTFCGPKCEDCFKCLNDEDCIWRYKCLKCCKAYPICFQNLKRYVLTYQSVPLCQKCQLCEFIDADSKQCDICSNRPKNGKCQPYHCSVHCWYRFQEIDQTVGSKKVRHRNPTVNMCTFCHEGHNVIHCDKKPQNKLLNATRRQLKKKKLEPEVRVVGIVARNVQNTNSGIRKLEP